MAGRGTGTRVAKTQFSFLCDWVGVDYSLAVTCRPRHPPPFSSHRLEMLRSIDRFIALVLLTIALVTILSCHPSRADDAEEARLGFVSLFDGKTFEGWHHEGNWVIQDGALYRQTRGGSLTYTAAEVPDDFELRFEWKVSEGCNSGVYYRPGQVEYQVLDNANSPYGENPRQSAASLFFCMAPDRDATLPHAHWNSGRILCQGTVIEHWLNGQRVVSFDYSDPRWKAEVDLLAIRGGDLTGRGGSLWLQDHGQDVWFRHLRWREIPESESLEANPDFRPMPVAGAGLANEQERVKRMFASRRDAAPRPNFVVIMADDLGWGDVGCYGHGPIATPNIDSLATEGVRFTDAHSPATICSPTRYGLMTGTDPCRRYHTSHVLFNGEPLMIREGQATVASILDETGYRTGVVGKWHLGLGDTFPRNLASPGRGPGQVGFRFSFIVPDGHNMLPKYYLANGQPYGDATDLPYPSRLTVIDRLGYKLLEHRPQTDWPDHRKDAQIGSTLAEQAIAFIESAARDETPFFLYLPTCAIHTPHEPDERFRGKSRVGAHGDFVIEFDWLVGEVSACLQRLGLTDDTLLIVTSDNGGLPGARKLGHNASGPWSGFKGSALEGGHRVPLIARWPNRIAAATTSDALVSLTDLTATATTLAGGFLSPFDALDSYDQSPLLLGQTNNVRRSLMVTTRGCNEMVLRQGAHKLTYHTESKDATYVNLAQNPSETASSDSPDKGRVRAMLEEFHAYFANGASRPGAIARGMTVAALLSQREERNGFITQQVSPSP